LSNYALTLNTKHIQIKREFNALQLFGDQEKVQTILDNLLSNAIKFTPTAGTILIRAFHEGDDVYIEVHDGGPGVLAADKAKLFDPFYRGDGVYESLVSGSGLGLSIAKEYADAHGGDIRLLPSDHGAHFSVRLPFKAENHE
jgi:two-component system sensor histidine kinase GlrK